VGTLKYPKLNAPDMKFAKNGVGSFSAKIILTGDEAAPLIKRIDELAAQALVEGKAALEEKIASAKGEAKGKAKKALAEFALTDKPYKPCYDDEGEANGNYEFNFKMSSQYTDKDGKVKKLSPTAFDAKGQKLDPMPDIWGGTRARVSGHYNPFATALGAGCALRLAGVKIITLVAGGSGRSADSMGFGGEEEGYSAPERDEFPEGGDDAPSGDGSPTPPPGEEDF
jgi:hypothetical protein